MRCVLLLVAVLAVISPRMAWADAPSPAPAVTDPTAVKLHYREVVARPEFHESDDSSNDMRWDDYLGQWMRRLFSRFEDLQYVGQLSSAARVLVVVASILAIGGLVRLIYLLSRRRRELEDVDFEAPALGKTFLTPRQYEKRLREAVAENDWHGAWLAAWLQLLARLENRRLVESDRSRTNREYLAQLRRQQLPPAAVPLLARLVDDYDGFIYGLRPIDEAGWGAFREKIDEVTLMLGLREGSTEELA